MGFALIAIACIATQHTQADDAKPIEADYYRLDAFNIPPEIVLEAGAIELLPDERIAVSTRRGEIFLVENAFTPALADIKFTRFAEGLHEVLGLAWWDGWLYAMQRCELSRLKDVDGDGQADLFETVNADWDITGDYHEYAFGSQFDRDGNIWVALCLTGSFNSEAKYRGWAGRITPAGKFLPTASGLRSPGGLGMNAEGDMFYTDNQGPWNGTCSLKWLRPGSFQGHPAGNRWYDIARDTMGPRPADPQSGSRIMTEAKKIPELEPSAVLFPYEKMGQSASGIACDTTDGKFGPFRNQLFVGDQTQSTVMRVSLEKVNGHYQGACYPFRQGFGSGSLSLRMAPDGSLFVGGTNRGWGSRGNKPWSLDRLRWTGKTPFEIQTMSTKPDGFELTFTEPVDAKTAGDVASYKLSTYTYLYREPYGSPEVDHTTPSIKEVRVAPDGKSVRLIIDGLQVGHIHELHAAGVRSSHDLPLLHDVAYYTLNYVPAE